MYTKVFDLEPEVSWTVPTGSYSTLFWIVLGCSGLLLLVPAHSRLFWFILACSGWLQVITSFTSDTHLESALPSQPKKCKVISCKGQKTLQIVTGSDRDNTTILAAVSARKNIPIFDYLSRETRDPNSNANHEFYPWIYSNEKGLMKANKFHTWFVEWEIKSRTEKKEWVFKPWWYTMVIYAT